MFSLPHARVGQPGVSGPKTFCVPGTVVGRHLNVSANFCAGRAGVLAGKAAPLVCQRRAAAAEEAGSRTTHVVLCDITPADSIHC